VSPDNENGFVMSRLSDQDGAQKPWQQERGPAALLTLSR